AELKDGLLRDYISSITNEEDIELVGKWLNEEAKRRHMARITINRDRRADTATTEETIPRRITSLDELPTNLPSNLQMQLYYSTMAANIPMINRILSDFHRIRLETRDKYRFRRLAARDLRKALYEDNTGESPPPGMAISIMEHLTHPNIVDTSELHLPDLPLVEKFVIHPFSNAEVKLALKRIRSTAAGPDKVNGKTVCELPPEIWRLFFNKIIELQHMPESWKAAKLSIIDKDADTETPRDTHEKSRWRPICVASAVQRTFFVVIAKRLTSYATSHGLVGGYQRGFIPEVDGCMLNIFEMRQWLAESHEHNAVCIDISDAYGSISHNILEVMLSRIIHPASLNIFRAAISTHIHYGEETITTRRGTAQGSAISPILFNMALDIVLNDESKLKIRAFADDITILSTGIEAEEDTKMVVESL
ncbi:hypothetical protein ADUPG1_000679, partial [Aduncisulcus paluster]